MYQTTFNSRHTTYKKNGDLWNLSTMSNFHPVNGYICSLYCLVGTITRNWDIYVNLPSDSHSEVQQSFRRKATKKWLQTQIWWENIKIKWQCYSMLFVYIFSPIIVLKFYPKEVKRSIKMWRNGKTWLFLGLLKKLNLPKSMQTSIKCMPHNL